MRNINNIIGVKSLYHYSNHIIYRVNNETFINHVSIGEGFSILKFSNFNNTLYYFQKPNLLAFKEGVFEVICQFENFDKVEVVSGELVKCYREISDSEVNYTFVNRINHQILWEKSGSENIKNVTPKTVRITEMFDESKFRIHDISTGNCKWHYTLPEGFTIFNKVQAVNEVLFFEAYKDNFRYNKVIGLHIETGAILWEHSYESPFVNSIFALLINKTDNLCYGMTPGFYQVFDPQKGEILVHKNIEEQLPEGCEPELHRQAIYEGKLWFVGGCGSNASFGALDIATGAIDFVQKYPLEADEQFDTPVYHEGKLYLRGLHYNTLHIFENE